jgi:hypothetical protein
MTTTAWMCALCTDPLLAVVDPPAPPTEWPVHLVALRDENGVVPALVHDGYPVGVSADHPPAPGVREFTACDSCSMPDRTHVLPTPSLVVVNGRRPHPFLPYWAACTLCAALIRSDRWGKLTRRYMDQLTRKHIGEVDVAYLRFLHNLVRSSVMADMRLLAVVE